MLTGDVLTQLQDCRSDLIRLLDAGTTANTADRASADTTSAESARPSSTGDTFFDFVSRKDRSGASAWQANQHPHAFARYVEPVKSFLLSRVGLDKEFVKGEGCTLFDEHGQSYLDFVSQYGALPFGYNPPEIWEALLRLRARSAPAMVTQSLLPVAGELARRLVQIAPGNMQHVIFCNSGAESTEIAVKLCRAATGRMGILSTTNSFHGLTLGALTVTGNRSFAEGFVDESGAVTHVAFGHIEALANAIDESPTSYAAFVVEPIQGEGGIVDAPPGYLRAAEQLCRERGILFVVDEVQTGLGRTGKMFACEHDGVQPDVLTLAKALGGGLIPIGAVLCQPKAYSDRFGLRHSSTFAGNALACQAGLATLDRLQRDGQALVRHVEACGLRLATQLASLQQKYPGLIRSISGRGFMVGISLNFTQLEEQPGLMPFLADQHVLIHLIVSYLLNVEHIRVAPSFSGRHALRVEPPLIMTEPECDAFAAALDRALALIDQGQTAALLAPMINAKLPANGGREIGQSSAQTVAVKHARKPSAPAARKFGFLVHLSSVEDLSRFDESLAAFDREQLRTIKTRLANYVDPFKIGELEVVSTTGQRVLGEFVMIPFTPEELVDMPAAESLELIQRAAETAAAAHPLLIGLGGFTSVLSHGGLALERQGLPPITTGNAYTVAMVRTSLLDSMRRLNRPVATQRLTVVGAAGLIGRATALLLSDHVRTIVLAGNPVSGTASQSRLYEVAREVERRNPETRILVTLDLADALRDADAVVTATSATAPFLGPSLLPTGTIVCDVGRPASVHPSVVATRHDVTLIEGGLVHLPGEPSIDLYAGPDAERAYACVAEAALWALSGDAAPLSLSHVLDVDTIDTLVQLGHRHGFTNA